MTNDADFETIHRKFGGSSFAAALFGRGYGDMPSAWSVFAHFSGLLEAVGPDEDANNRVRLGKLIEPAIAAETAFRTGWDLLEAWEFHRATAGGMDPRPRIFVHHPDDTLKIGCTVDRYVREHEDGPGIIEIKNRDYLAWVTDYTADEHFVEPITEIRKHNEEI